MIGVVAVPRALALSLRPNDVRRCPARPARAAGIPSRRPSRAVRFVAFPDRGVVIAVGRGVRRRVFLWGAGGGLAAVAVAGAVGDVAAQPREAWSSAWLWRDASGALVYRSDLEGNRIPDFGYAGYRYGAPLPVRPVVRRVGPVAGDNTARIQDAIDEVSALPRAERGCVLLAPGTYEVRGVLDIRASGVVLRGAGDGADPATNTVLRATGTDPERTVVRLGAYTANPWSGRIGERVDVTTDFVPVGARTFRVSDASGLAVGHNIVIEHPCTQAWLDAVDGGGTAGSPPWQPGAHPLRYNRFVTAVTGDVVSIDAPVFNHLDRGLAQSFVYRWDRAGLITESGIESLRVDIAHDTGNPQDENHARNAIRLGNAQDCWVRDCTTLHFSLSGIQTDGTTRSTIQNCKALDPVSVVEGGKRYNFGCWPHSQQLLFVDCVASHGRHAYVSNGTSTVSGVVFLDCVSQHNLAASEGHRRWSQGLLFDGFREPSPDREAVLGLHNRGNYGTSHGWGAVHSVAWNCATPVGHHIVVQKPPTAQNWAIGCAGTVTGDGPFDQPAGRIEGANQADLTPVSLYRAQREYRVGTPYRHHGCTADAYVRGGAYRTRNFGGAGELLIKESESADVRRQVYLKFTLAGETSVRVARLRLNAGMTSGTTALWVGVHGVPDTGWSESAITWDTRPAPDARLLSSNPVAGPAAAFEWDVTGWVRAELAAGRRTVSFALVGRSAQVPVVVADSRTTTTGIGPRLLVS